jgi:HEPN domain-containing protein
MNAPREVVEVVQQWVRKAEHDLEAARRILAVEEGCPYDTACFHCQQAVEKYLEALLTSLAIQAPRTHDLEELAALLTPEQALSVPLGELVGMTPYAVDARYADDWREPGIEEARRSLALANRVRGEVRPSLPAEALE